MPGMSDAILPNRSYPLAVIMERTVLTNRWVSEKWEAKGVVQDSSAPGSPPRVIVESDGLTQVLHPGYRLQLARDEAEGYFLNLTSPEPKVFILWRLVDALPRPEMLTVSYGEGTRWADSGEQVDGVPIPVDLVPWIGGRLLLRCGESAARDHEGQECQQQDARPTHGSPPKKKVSVREHEHGARRQSASR